MDKQQAVLILYGILNGKSLNHEDLIETIKKNMCCMPNYRSLNKDEIEDIAYAYEYTYGSQTFEPGDTLTNFKADETWFHKKKKTMLISQHSYQNRYEQYLIKEHYGDDAKNNIINEAEKILSLCADPESNEKKRGLVMGDVQSGKTSNYLALANLACDYGYKIVLILAGITDSLRIQTQERTDEGLVGAVSSTIGNNEKIDYIGVGRIGDGGHYAIPLTTDIADFTGTNNFTSNDLNKPQILVVKKNKSILTSVKKWLKPGQTNISSKNILIIDDECDNASVNTRKLEDDPSTINGLIRDIYNNFNCSTYVGYTATPFANIFINPEKEVGNDDLFPSDFIHRLKSSKNKVYFGIDKVFKGDIKHWKKISDDENNKLPAKHKKDDDIPMLWDSLKNSICMFLICNCIRTIRGDGFKHRSMMINVSPYNLIQNRMLDLVERYVVSLRDAIQQYDRYDIERFVKHFELKRIYDIYETDSLFCAFNEVYNKPLNEAIPFEKIKNYLFDEISKFRVVVINNKVKGDQRFKYKDYKETGARVIAIGGFVLSRGITLEGLMTSYYSRNSTAYDTLLQMCRWFGYRPQYEDLCSIYMSQISYDCFCAVSDAIDNLDSQLEMMAARGAAPKEFGLMILESPETLETNLLITARNKMRNSTEIVRGLNYSGVAIDTSKLYKSPYKNETNYNSVKKLINELHSSGKNVEIIKNRYMIRDVNNSIIADFVSELDIPLENKKFDVESISSFIRKGEYYDKWDIVFAKGDEKPGEKKFKINDNYSIPLVHRSFAYDKNEDIVRIAKNNNKLLDPGIFNAGLNDKQIEIAKATSRERAKRKNSTNENLIANDYLGVPNRKPLLVIFPVQLIQDDKNDNNSDFSEEKKIIIDDYNNHDTLIGIGIGFAGREGKVMMNFRINKVKQKEYINKFVDTEDELTDD